MTWILFSKKTLYLTLLECPSTCKFKSLVISYAMLTFACITGAFAPEPNPAQPIRKSFQGSQG